MVAETNRDQFSMLKMADMQNCEVITQLNIYRKTVLKAWKMFKEEQTRSENSVRTRSRWIRKEEGEEKYTKKHEEAVLYFSENPLKRSAKEHLRKNRYKIHRGQLLAIAAK